MLSYKKNKLNRLNFNLKNKIFTYLLLQDIFINIFPVSSNFSSDVKKIKIFSYIKSLCTEHRVTPANTRQVNSTTRSEHNLVASSSSDKTIKLFNIFTAEWYSYNPRR